MKNYEWYENRWDSAKLGRRIDLIKMGRWIDKKGKLTNFGSTMAETKWKDLSPAVQNILKRKIDELYGVKESGVLSR